MRARLWIFTALVALALALNLARVSLSIAQTGEDSMRARVASATAALRTQFDLLDARLAPRAVASAPDLVEAVRAPADPAQPPPRPDERALRAAAAVLAPEPDFLAVVTPQGAVVSRRAKPAQMLDDAGKLPLAHAATGATPAPVFAPFEGATYRFEAARIPGAQAAVLVGTVIDDRLAAQLKSQVDADVTLLQGGKVIASSLPQGEERARLSRWAASPGPGYGVLQIRLPLIGTALSGKVPRGTSRFAVRGALVSLDGGVQAAVTVPASPYLAWLGRYQAFYIAGLALLLLFGFLWGLGGKPEEVIQRVELTEPQSQVMGPPRRQQRPSLLETDAGEARPNPPPRTRDVPWSPGEGPSGEHPVVEAAAAGAAAEATAAVPAVTPAEAEAANAPAVPAAAEENRPAGEEARPAGEEKKAAEAPGGELWSFAPTPGQFTKEETAEPAAVASEAAAASPAPDWEMPVPLPPAEAAPQPAPSSGGKEDFSFAALLGEATPAGTPPPESGAAEEKAPSAPFPGDEPTRIEPVSAALLEKLRERDEEGQATRVEPVSAALLDKLRDRDEESAPPVPSEAGSGAAEPQAAPAQAAAGPAAAEGSPAEAPAPMAELSPAPAEEPDPDEPHWRETFDRFRELKAQLGEPVDRITFERFAAKLKKNRADLVVKHRCKGVRFSVYEKDGRAAIKASAIR
ncbi:MAG TPA: MXAN_5187 C-terminal domain-containing protein [Myxococcales bacterium]